MSANPRFTILMTNLRNYDQLTLILAGISLAAVLIGWAMLGDKTPAWQRRFYFGFLLVAYIFILAGCTYLIITGGAA
jgi:phosphoglycerol transferase MdoB-like AlkP superfamily enzyme